MPDMSTDAGSQAWGDETRTTIFQPAGTLQLPDVLEQRADGAVVVRGHRITLFALLELVESVEQTSVADICQAFPTLSVETAQGVLQFIAAHREELLPYVAQQRRIADRHELRFPLRGASLAEMRNRKQAARK